MSDVNNSNKVRNISGRAGKSRKISPNDTAKIGVPTKKVPIVLAAKIRAENEQREKDNKSIKAAINKKAKQLNGQRKQAQKQLKKEKASIIKSGVAFIGSGDVL